jgi:hypothetical protein
MLEMERLSPADEQSLLPLVELSSHLTIVGNRIRAIDMLKVPLDGNGIPKRADFLRDVLGTVATNHYWTGYVDIHHLAWPGNDYRTIQTDEHESLGAAYRGAAALKIRLPRQLHNYIHKISLEPPIPPIDVMRQWVFEQTQIYRLYDTVRLSNLDKFEADDATKESLQYRSYQEKVAVMRDGKFGLMPDREHLSKLELEDARRTLRCLARARGLTNARSSRRQFFSDIAA